MPVRSLHHVAFTAPDLDKLQEFVEDFGLLVVEKSDDHLVARTGGTDAWCYRAERGESGFLGLGFLVDDESDLHDAVANHGATELRALATPGGGVGVTLTTPDGLKVDLVHGIAGDTPAEVQPRRKTTKPSSWLTGGWRRGVGSRTGASVDTPSVVTSSTCGSARTATASRPSPTPTS